MRCRLLPLLLLSLGAVAQDAKDKLSPRELTIPTSPLFDLMGQAPSQVARTADIRDFKVDWSFRNWKLSPNLAIEAQPVWEIAYNRKGIAKYQQAKPFARRLSTLDVAVGTVTNEQNDRRIGWSLKMNLYRQNDPLLLRGVYDDINEAFDAEFIQLNVKEKELMARLDTVTHPARLKALRDELRQNDQARGSFYYRRNTAIQERAKGYVTDNWNAAFVDIAFGKIYTYATDSAGSLGKLRVNRNSGSGLWLNFGVGIGKRGLLSGLVRSSFYEEELNFQLRDENTGTEETASAIAANRLYTFGVNMRYGGPVYSFFVEFLREAKSVKTPTDALSEAFTAPGGKVVVTSTVKWDIVQPYALNIGGDWRISRNVILNYGLRCVLDNNLKATSFIPIANISCMMR
ncbi:MAG: hypothetical protein EOO15_03655 [Chitinophagaceae bacterium]|nr:MAG: hypothetical protein EOO15_03655 [Chitinophagaceae bacterium]